jgi:SAM-dependent methyltransferase
LPHRVSAALAKENAIHAAHVKRCPAAGLRWLYPEPIAYCRNYLESAEGRQFRTAVDGLPAGCRVFDVGAGQGKLSVALAAWGFQTTAVEPCPELCAWIDDFAQAFGLPLSVVCCTAEGLAAHEPEAADVCMFSASLHHCDDPLAALNAAHRLLAPGGTLLLLNEPHLQRFRSKSWFARMLAEGECPAGDYGGNEHTYYWHEYRRMIRSAGFTAVQDSVAERYRNPESYRQMMAEAGASASAKALRSAYYRFVRGMEKLGPLGSPALSVMKRLSLLQMNYTAKKAA